MAISIQDQADTNQQSVFRAGEEVLVKGDILSFHGAISQADTNLLDKLVS